MLEGKWQGNGRKRLRNAPKKVFELIIKGCWSVDVTRESACMCQRSGGPTRSVGNY